LIAPVQLGGIRTTPSPTYGYVTTHCTTDWARVVERRRAVALARHYREAEGLSITQIADRLGRSPATVKAYFYDPTGAKARAVKARYQGVCRGCGAYTQPRNGTGDAYAFCKACHSGAIEPRWTRERVLAAMFAWEDRYGRLPSSYDWSLTHARRRGGRGGRATQRRRLALTECRDQPLWELDGSTRGRYEADRRTEIANGDRLTVGETHPPVRRTQSSSP
jgi:hypothetical protein